MQTNVLGFTIDLDRDMTPSTCGRIGIAKRYGRKFFCKEFVRPVAPPDDDSVSEKARKEMNREFQEFALRKSRVNQKLRTVSHHRGNLITPVKEGVFHNHWYEFTEYYGRTIPIGEVTARLSAMSEKDRIRELRSIAAAVADLHDRAGIIHGDLKPENLLPVPASRGRAIQFRIIDFDGAMPVDDIPVRSVTGTANYFSPELAVYSNRSPAERRKIRRYITPKSDIFSLGLIFHYLLTGTLPRPVHLPEKLQKVQDSGRFVYAWQAAICEGSREGTGLALSKEISAPVRALISRMLSRDSADRPSADEVMELLDAQTLPLYPGALWAEDASLRPNVHRIQSDLIGFRKTQRRGKDGPCRMYELMTPDGCRSYRTGKELRRLGYLQSPRDFADPRPGDGIFWTPQIRRLFSAAEPGEKPGMYCLTDQDGSTEQWSVEKLLMTGLAEKKKAAEPERKERIQEKTVTLWPEDSHWRLNTGLLSKWHASVMDREVIGGQHYYRLKIGTGEELLTSQKMRLLGLLRSR